MNAVRKLYDKKIVITGDDITIDGESFPVLVAQGIKVRKMVNADGDEPGLYGVDVMLLVGDVEVQRDTLNERQNESIVEVDDAHLDLRPASVGPFTAAPDNPVSADDFEHRETALRYAVTASLPGDATADLTARADAFYRYLTGRR